MKVMELFETQVTTYKGDINVPEHWKDLSGLPELYPGYTAGCKLIGDFDAGSYRSLTSLKGGPQEVSGYFYCDNCISLISLEGAPKSVGGYFNCSECKSLTSLEGAPQSVGGQFDCTKCTSLTSLKGIGKEYLLEVDSYIDLNGCRELKSHMLGILLIKKFKHIYFNVDIEVQNIINKHLRGDRDILECQEEFITHGLRQYAKL
jgi:hypothetical protein